VILDARSKGFRASNNRSVSPDLIAAILWIAFACAIVLGLIAIRVSDRTTSLIGGIIATALLVGFSWLAGLSIGPFTIALPVLLTATIASRRAPLAVRILLVAVAAGIYRLVTWQLQPIGSWWTLVLPALCALAYAAAFLLSRVRRQPV
jgi:hypothetical protein